MNYKFMNSNGEPKASYYDREDRFPSIVMSPQGGVHYTVNITQDFGDAFTFDNVIALLTNATELDDITFNISSRGGNLFSLIAVQNAISMTQARYHMVLLGEACSAGGALFLTEGADSYQIGKGAMLMIHPVQCGTGYGAAGESQIRADANTRLNESFVRSSYKDFLTKEEIDDVIYNNREIYLFDEEINERLEKRIEIRKAEIAEKMAQLEQAIDDIEEFGFDEISDDILKAERDKINAELKKRRRVAANKVDG